MATAETSQGSSFYLIEIRIAPDCQLPSIRCFQVLQELDALGTTLQTWPERDVVEAGSGEFTLIAALTSRQADDELQAAIKIVTDVEAVTVRKIPSEELAKPIEVVSAATPAPTAAAARPQLAPRGGLPASPSPKRRAARRRKPPTQSVRIDVERLDGLMNLVANWSSTARGSSRFASSFQRC